MKVVIISIILVALSYWLSKPDDKTKRQAGRPKKAKKFGKGLFTDTNGWNWWKPGDGGL